MCGTSACANAWWAAPPGTSSAARCAASGRRSAAWATSTTACCTCPRAAIARSPARVRSGDTQMVHLVVRRPHGRQAGPAGARRLHGQRRRVPGRRMCTRARRSPCASAGTRRTASARTGTRRSPPTRARTGRSTGATTSRAPAPSRRSVPLDAGETVAAEAADWGFLGGPLARAQSQAQGGR